MSPDQPLSPLPTLTAQNLILRPLAAADAQRIQRLAGSWAVARNCGRIPHPYPDGAAEAWIAGSPRRYESGLEALWAVCPVEEGSDRAGDLVGEVGLVISPGNHRAELGYWIGETMRQISEARGCRLESRSSKRSVYEWGTSHHQATE